jgi:hypothetical protein
MAMLRSISIVTLVVTLAACAQTPVDRTTARPMAAAAPAPRPCRSRWRRWRPTEAMREMHDKMMRARTPEERNALMTEQMKLMQDGMAMMGGMGGGMGGMKGMGGMGAMQGGKATPADMATRQQMMEKRMEMMQSMMQMMMDRMQQPAAPRPSNAQTTCRRLRP